MKKPICSAKMMVSVFLILSLLFIATGKHAIAAEPIKVGVVLSVTGWGGMIGTPMKEAFIALADDFNKKGGLTGRPIQLYIEDDQSNPTNGVVAATKLVKDVKVAILMGPTITDTGMAMISIAEQEQVPFAITGPVIIPLKKWVFQVTPSDSLNLAYMLEYAVNHMKAKRIAVLHDTAMFGNTGWKVVQSEIKRYPDASVVIEEKFDVADTSVIPQLTKIKAANPDVMLIQSTGASSGVIAKNYKQLGMKIPVVAPPSAGTPEFFQIGGAIAEESKWVFLTAMATVGEQIPPSDWWRKTHYDPFVKIMQEKYGESKRVMIFHAVAYDDIRVVLEALKVAGTDSRAAVRDAFEKIRYVGMNGTIAFTPDDHRGITKWFGAAAAIKNGAFTPVELMGN